MHRRRIAMIGVVIAALIAVLGTTFAPASATTPQVTSNPANRSVLHAAPDSLTLTFAARPKAVTVSVTDSAKRSIRVGKLSVTGRTVVAKLSTKTPPGWFTVRYRARALDGHVVTGTLKYRVRTLA